MKKITFLFLALIMCLSLCACGKTQEAELVDEMILTIGTVTLESEKSINDAIEAYNSLSDKDRATVENYAILEKAQEDLSRLKDELFHQELDELTTSLLFLYDKSKALSEINIIIWRNALIKDISVDGCYNCIKLFYDENLTAADYIELYNSDTNTIWDALFVAAYGVCPEKVDDVFYFLESAEVKQEIIDLCAGINDGIALTSEVNSSVSEEFYSFNKKYKEVYQEETAIVNELFLELSMYAEHALDPTCCKNFESYVSETENFNNTIDRLIKKSTLK